MKKSLHRAVRLAICGAIVSLSLAAPNAADLILKNAKVINGNAIFDHVVITNGGELRITGDLTAKSVKVGRGTLNLDGNLNSPSLDVVRLGVANVNGTNNLIGSLTIHSNACLWTHGRWAADSTRVLGGGAIETFSQNETNPFSGTLTIIQRTLFVQEGGIISADKAGNDPRGRGGGFAQAGGGGSAGMGGASYWGDHVVGPAFGDASTDEISGGGRGWFYGGGAITLIADNAVINGIVRANGGDGANVSAYFTPGGGGGGGILIKTGRLALNGMLIANGGNGTDKAGAGGGGWIKLYYNSTATGDPSRRCFVAPGSKHPANRFPASPGMVVLNTIAGAPKTLSPIDKEVVVLRPLFSFRVQGDAVFGQPLTARIEISKDNFRRIFAFYDQRESPAGWSKNFYMAGDTAVFAGASLPPGTYNWRAQVFSGINGGGYSEPKSFTLISDHAQASLVIVNGGPYGFPGAVGFGFQSTHRVTYTVQVSRDLDEWENIPIIVVGDGNFKSFFVPADEPLLFYRLKEQQ